MLYIRHFVLSKVFLSLTLKMVLRAKSYSVQDFMKTNLYLFKLVRSFFGFTNCLTTKLFVSCVKYVFYKTIYDT